LRIDWNRLRYLSPPEEVGFDIYGSSEDPNSSANQGKPRSMQTLFLYFANDITL
jgi:hypothetical protein